MEPWRPWDASDDEYEDLLVVRELIPPTLREPLMAWLAGALTSDRWVSEARYHFIQSSLRRRLDASSLHVDAVTHAIEEQGDRFLLQVVDLLLANGTSTEDVRDALVLEAHMRLNASALKVDNSSGVNRLRRRMVEGVEESMQIAVDAALSLPAVHLANAVRQIQSLEPNTSEAMAEAIRAVEQAARAVVTPKDKQARLGKIVAALREKQGWSLALQQRDDGEPNHQEVLIGMLETLAFAQQNRHGGAAPGADEATAHVLLASTLVGWFSTGAVRMPA
ncbi:hypothetical protein [Microbacterium sp. LWO13-1.2]|uniref:hypothetical protein n=1 Tax=Microbacterium sp. LWO13-1.2 TaxID=3135262 RepID=UPI00313888C9